MSRIGLRAGRVDSELRKVWERNHLVTLQAHVLRKGAGQAFRGPVHQSGMREGIKETINANHYTYECVCVGI